MKSFEHKNNNDVKRTGINRRQFILRTSSAAAIPFLLNGIPIRALEGSTLDQLFNTTEESDRVLVLLQLAGGNDGLNTIIPLDQYSKYSSLRPSVAIPEAAAIDLKNGSGLHPTLTSIKTLYDQKKVGIIQGVTYPNPNLSHFRSSDIWMSGSASNVNWSTGWMGRYLNTLYPGYPTGYPNTTMPDPVAIQMTAVVGLTLIGAAGQSMAMALQDPETFYSLVNGTDAPSGDLPTTPYAAANVEFVREVQVKSIEYSAVIKDAADKAQNIAVYPTANKLADQLKIVARLVAGGLKTRVYVVQLNGFDNHSAQVDSTDPTIGEHATLLQTVNDAVTAFQQDLEALKVDDRVVTMSFSEFGRRPASNLSLGTDHGTAAPMLFVGTLVQDGITGHSPDLEDLDNGNLKMQYDFRQIYASVLEQWFGADHATITSILGTDFTTVRVIKNGTTNVQEDQEGFGCTLQPIAPNPVRDGAMIRYRIETAQSVRLDVFDALGFHVQTLVSQQQQAGSYEVAFNSTPLPSGTYMVQLVVGSLRLAQHMVVVR